VWKIGTAAGVDQQWQLVVDPAATMKIPQFLIERMAKIMKVACPYCGAAIGEFCRSKHGNRIISIGQVHDARLSGKLTKRAMSQGRIRNVSQPHSR
jgi:hypothetical protein